MRTVSEWVGKTDDSMPSEGVRLRIFIAANQHCQVCTMKIQPGKEWHLDHRVPLWGGGENAERNLQVICHPCHKNKTAVEATERAIGRRKASKHLLGPKRSRTPFPGGRASKWKRTVDGRTVLREEKD